MPYDQLQLFLQPAFMPITGHMTHLGCPGHHVHLSFVRSNSGQGSIIRGNLLLFGKCSYLVKMPWQHGIIWLTRWLSHNICTTATIVRSCYTIIWSCCTVVQSWHYVINHAVFAWTSQHKPMATALLQNHTVNVVQRTHDTLHHPLLLQDSGEVRHDAPSHLM